MADARDRGWKNPDMPGFRTLYIDTGFKHSGVPFPGGVHKKIRKLAHAMLDELEQTGYRLKSPGCWAYYNRDIRGRPGVKSNHSWGLALDVNAPSNPMTDDNRVHTNLPPNAGKIANKYGFRWGGDYTGTRKDPMHFEFMGSRADAKRLTAQLSEVKPTPVVPDPSTPIPVVIEKGSADMDWATVKLGDTGRKVRVIQALLKARGFPRIKLDGKFGTSTKRKVKKYQRRNRLFVDGEVGPNTMKSLLKHNTQ